MKWNNIMRNTYICHVALFSVMTVSSLTVSSAPITHNGYTLETTTNIVTGGGLEWLQWDVTVGQTINTALGTYAADGWVLASNTDMKNLFDVFFPVGTFGVAWDTNENSYRGGYTQWNTSENSVQNNFIELFGDTQMAGGGSPGNVEDPYTSSRAAFGHDLDNDGLYNLTIVMDDRTLLNGSTGDAYQTMGRDMWGSNDSGAWFGVALVRDITLVQSTNINVPEPSTLLLMSAGLLGLGIRRRR